MSYFDARIEFTEETERFRGLLDELTEEWRKSAEVANQISDEVYTAIATEALEEGQKIPLAQATVERKTRVTKPKTKRRKGKKKGRGRRKSGRWSKVAATETNFTPFGKGTSYYDLVAALTTTTDFDQGDHFRGRRRSHQSTRLFGGGSPVALREIERSGDGYATVLWGSKRWVDYLHPHIDGTKNGVPARLAMLQPKRWEPEAADRAKYVIAGWMADKLEKAGAPFDWVQQILEDRA